ncbi:MAG: hypothetical protein KDH09_07245, partial [Chrysiogenetes bacterium]|nr:hypothetical protein [Chrysiogenetes bacterium]
DAGRWYRVGMGGTLDTTLVAEGIARYSSGSLAASVANYEDGSSAGTDLYWTGTNDSGAIDSGFTCTDWNSTSNQGRPGQADQSGTNWTNFGSGACSNAYKLLCIQTD